MLKRSGDSPRLGDVSEMLMQKPPLGTPLDWENPLNDGTALAFAMNEGHGDKLRDLSLNGNHGTLNNFAFPPSITSGWNPGQTGIGLISDGINDCINCGNNPSLNITDALTIACQLNTVDASGYICQKNNATADGNRYGIFCSNVKIDFVYTTAAGDRFVAWNNPIDDGEWHQVVTTVEGLSAYLYIDGVNMGLQTLTDSMIGDDANPLYIGCRPPGGVYMAATFDGFRINNRAWSAKEVKSYTINPWQVYEQ